MESLASFFSVSGRIAPKPFARGVVVDAARNWGLPYAYIRSLQRWSPSRWRGARTTDSGELG